MPTFTSDGLSLFCLDVGSGPALVLIHGWGATGDEWEGYGWLPVLEGRRLLMPDVRGHGRSAKPHDVAAYGMDKIAGDVGALLEHIGLQEADVFGYSMGGAIALWVAVSFPWSVRSLVAGAASGRDPDLTRAMGRQLRGIEPMTDRARLYHDYAVEARAPDLEALAYVMESGVPAPPCAELAVYGGEALVVVGDRDGRAAFTEQLAGCLPGGRFLLLPGADHMGAFGDARLKDAVKEFLAEVSPL